MVGSKLAIPARQKEEWPPLHDVQRTGCHKKQQKVNFSKRKTRNRFHTIGCKTDRRKMSFFPRTVHDWNSLPPDIKELDSLCAIKARIVNHVGPVCKVAFFL